MFNFVHWSKDNIQITLEGTSFYYVGRAIVAFRLPGNEQIVAKDDRYNSKAQNFVSKLKHMGKVKYYPHEPFMTFLETAYKKALFSGAKRIAMQRMDLAIETVTEEAIHVTNPKDDDSLSKGRDAGHEQQKSAFDR